MLLSIDAGTTHCKAALFEPNGRLVAVASRPSPLAMARDREIDPLTLWTVVDTVVSLATQQVREGEGRTVSIACIGIASMAETGVLVDRQSGSVLTPLIPWFDTASRPQTRQLQTLRDPRTQFLKTGVHLLPKHGITKLRWLLDTGRVDARASAVWLSAADFLVFQMTHQFATDPTLAARTGAFDIDEMAWDTSWLETCGIPPEWFPSVIPSGEPIGRLSTRLTTAWGLSTSPSVAIAGHDHLCALYAFAHLLPRCTLDSMGTAETLIGQMPSRPLTSGDYGSGLLFGNHVDGRHRFWLGSLSSSGAAVEWFRRQLCQPALSYPEFMALLQSESQGPTGILYVPYIDSERLGPSGVFAGLKQTHTRGQMARAVLEGTAYAMEYIRRQAQVALSQSIEDLIAVGGGTRNAVWLQIKADVSGTRVLVPQVEEATLLGAAVLAGVKAGLYPSQVEAGRSMVVPQMTEVIPDASRHDQYQAQFIDRYLPLYESLVT